jgi:outer membrane lipopolysaccharide assembly protein LptE/RlpB
MVLNRKSKSRSGTRLILSFLLIGMAVMLSGCGIYSFSGASISESVKTFSVQYFQNRASLVQPGLSQGLTNALIDKCKGQTNLKYVTGIGDVNFEGEITDYSTKPYTVAADAQAASNRFTITVKVKFTNSAEPDYSFEQSFSRYQDYNSSLDLNAVEKDLAEIIVEALIEDIFNQAFVNW